MITRTWVCCKKCGCLVSFEQFLFVVVFYKLLNDVPLKVWALYILYFHRLLPGWAIADSKAVSVHRLA